jgi:catechol 2,3-dioxygenase-like lactoylglutathione lyase family enzyme
MNMSSPSFCLDHLVILVADLEQAVADYKALGFNIFPGGEHPGRGSRNALVVFADGAYLELITFNVKVPDFRWWQVFDRDGEGFVDFALLPGDLDAAVSAARKRGAEVLDPEDGGRARPDGVSIAWRTARPATSDLPFLCFDVTPRELRVPEGEARRHANGVTGVSRLTIAVRDIATSLPRYQAYLDVTGTGASLNAEGLQQAVLPISGAELVLVSPGPDGEASAALSRRLDARGEGPLALALKGTKTLVLDAALLHGAGITVMPD